MNSKNLKPLGIMKTKKTNSFGILRLFFALLVIYEHSFILGGFGKEPLSRITDPQLSTAFIAVSSFFIISGYLITKSYLSSRNVFQFALKRFLRIMPGFWMCLIFTAFVLGPLVFVLENNDMREYMQIHDNSPLAFVTSNFFLLMHQYEIDQLLASNPFPGVFNGSLWTLFIEAKAYVFLGILGLTGVLRRRIIVTFLYFLGIIFIATQYQIPHIPNPIVRLLLDQYFIVFLTYFLGGAVLFLYKDTIKTSNKIAALSLLLLLIAAFLHQTLWVLALTWPYIVIFLAFKLPLKGFDRKIDISYGTYIYAFPVMQIVALLFVVNNVFIFFCLSILFTLPFALFSWFVIEKPALKLKSFRFSKVLHFLPKSV